MKYSAKTVPKNQIPYKLAKAYKANLDLSKSWYVYYYYLEGEKYVRFRVKANVNRVNSIAHRVWAIDELCSSINEMLQNGIIPHLYDNYQDKKTDSFFNKCEVLKSEILNLYEKNTSKPYISAINIICDFLSNKKNIDCKKISDEHFSDFKIWLKSSGNRTNRTVNNILKNCNTIFNKMIEKKWLKYNPMSGIKLLPQETGINKAPFTIQEIDKIKNHLLKHKPQLWFAFQHIYYCSIRPNELVNLQAKNYLLSEKMIFIFKDSGKNNRSLPVGIPDPFLEEILKNGIQKLSKDDYIFSEKDTLNPGTIKRTTDPLERAWKKLVKEDLGIDKDLYTAKHTANIMLLQSGVNPKELQFQNRHSSLMELEHYSRSMSINPNAEIYKKYQKI